MTKPLQFNVTIQLKDPITIDGTITKAWEVMVNGNSAGLSRSKAGVAMLAAYYVQTQITMALRNELPLAG